MIEIAGLVAVAQHCLHIRDISHELETGWTNESPTETGVGVARGVVSVTALARAAGIMPVFLEVWPSEPSFERLAGFKDQDVYDAVIDASLACVTGVLRIEGEDLNFEHGLSTTPTLDLRVAAGDYRVRIAYASGDTATYDGVDGAEHVRISIWPAAPADIVVHRAFATTDRDDEPVRRYQGSREAKAWAALLPTAAAAGVPAAPPSLQCVAVVALARLGDLETLRETIALTPFDAVRRVTFSALGFLGKPGLPLIDEETYNEDRDLRLRLAQSLRLVGGKPAKKIARELLGGIAFDTLQDAVDEIA
jgi:hypothetical protein